MKVSGIIFDKDGTLIDFDKVWLPAARTVICRIMKHYKIPCTAENEMKISVAIGIVDNYVDAKSSFAYKTYSEIAADIIAVCESIDGAECISVIEKEELTDRLISYFAEVILDDGKEIESTADLETVLEALHTKGIKIGIATTDEYHAAVRCLERLEILNYFTFFAMDKMPIPMPVKPSGRIIKQAAEYWEINTDEILVVGDSINDMKFAHNGGAKAVGVLTGVSQKKDLLPEADYIIASVDALQELIYRLEQEK